MQLILDCFKRIFESLAGIYTKQESDAALAVKADKAEVEAEATARQEAISAEASRVDTRLAEHDAEIDTLQKVTAGLGEGAQAAANVAKWQTYATAIQKDLDAETAMQLAQEFNRATDEYLADPTATDDWNTTKDANGNITSKNPYFSTPPTKPVVNFKVLEAKGISLTNSSFATATNVPILMSSLEIGNSAFYKSGISIPPFVPNLKSGVYMFRDCKNLTTWTSPLSKLTDGSSAFAFSGLKAFSGDLLALSSGAEMFRNTNLTRWTAKIPMLKNGNWMYNGCNTLTCFYSEVPSLTTGVDMFFNTNLDKDSVILILNSLPDRTGISEAVITFKSNVSTAAINNIDSEIQSAIDSAVAKNWDVITA